MPGASGAAAQGRCEVDVFRKIAAIAALVLTAAPQQRATAAPEPLDSILEPCRAKYELPAIAAAVVVRGETVAAGAVGTRRVGTTHTVTLDDRFHIGSDTKAMTALLAGMMVEEGRLRWASTPAEVFPELAPAMDARVRTVTLEQLLSHTSGFPADNDDFGRLLEESVRQDGNLDDLRLWLADRWCRLPLANDPGTTFAYSNMGYTLVGAMIERAAGRSWDELISERVFDPLNLGTAGLGCQSSLGRVDAAVGHSTRDGRVFANMAGPNGDNPPIIGPAGIAHMSVLDFARWAGWNAGAGRRGPALVGPDTLRKLHTPVISMPPKPDAPPGTPPGGWYALGWGRLEVAWAPRPMLYHGGSNNMNLAHIWVDTEDDIAFVIMSNIAGERADAAFRELAPLLYDRAKKKGR